MKTYMANAQNTQPKWRLIDAQGQTLGRLATKIAMQLMGKHKPIYTPHCDTGDFIIVTNAKHIKVTGKKQLAKKYYQYSGYPSGMRCDSFDNLQQHAPERILKLAVQGMLPKGPLGRKMFKKLKIYSGNEHPHHAQQPETVN